MPVLIDGIIFSLQHHGGISVYFRELLSRLARDSVPACVTLYGRLLQEVPTAQQSLRVHHEPSRKLERYRRCLVASGQAVFHSTYYRRPSVASMPTVVTVHDFTYERCVKGPRQWTHSAQKFLAIRQAQAVICISEATRLDLLEFVGTTPGQDIHVVYNGVGDQFVPLNLPPPKQGFVLFVGQRAGYKNFSLALRALDHLPELELLCVGGSPIARDELDAAPEEVRRRVRYMGFVSDTELNHLYNQAVCLLYLSSYEGFGIPVIEAMRAGCPVVSTCCKAVLEVGRHALTVVPGDDPRSVAHAVSMLASGDARAARVRAGLSVASEFSWERTYQATHRIYRALAQL